MHVLNRLNLSYQDHPLIFRAVFSAGTWGVLILLGFLYVAFFG